jgi:hypothetical protein
MLRLVGHGVVSEKNNAGEVCRAEFHFVVEMKRGLRRIGLFTFLISSAVCGLSLRLVKFKLLIAAIRNAHGLLRTALQFVIQDHGLRDFLHGLAHLLALPLHGAIGFFLANFHLTLQNPFRALHQLSGFQLAG